MKKFFKFLFFLIFLLSLGLNILLLKEKLDKKKSEIPIDDVVNTNTDKKEEKVEYNKELIGKLFKDYQYTAEYAKTDNVVELTVDKVILVGHFKNNENKKVYVIKETFSCVEGTSCVVSDSIKSKGEYSYETEFIATIIAVDKDVALIEIKDETVYKDPEFVKDKEKEIK